MSDILKPGDKVQTQSSALDCEVEFLLGSGGQGEVYQAKFGNESVALKWMHPHYLQWDTNLQERLKQAIVKQAPSESFLWPLELVFKRGNPSFGYIMALRPVQYKSLIDLMKRTITPIPTMRNLTTAGFQLANSFFQLHAKGFCYRDISFGNVFFNPATGDVLICDNDNVDIDNREKTSAILGTPGFMAPEIIARQSRPNKDTDLYSLAVLLFYLLFSHHPLEGRKEAKIKCLDLPSRERLYGSEAVFIFDPQNLSNRPVTGYQDNALIFWQIYPQFLKDLFIQAFTKGLRNPRDRVQETAWRKATIRLRDSIIYCPHCRAENFYDTEILKTNRGRPQPCWSCKKEMKLPARLRLDKQIVMLNYDTKLYPHHIDGQASYDFSRPIAEMSQHPKNPNIWGLKNLSREKWVITNPNGEAKDVPPGRSVTLDTRKKISFGKVEGEVKI